MIPNKAYTLAEIASAIGGKLHGNKNETICRLLIDSRMVEQPKQSLFFALKGSHHQGSNFIEELVTIGVTCFVVQQPISYACNYIVVPDTLNALQLVSAWHFSHFKIPKIAICGSNGKTIVKEWLAQLLGCKYRISKSPMSYNSQVGVPLSLWLTNAQTEISIIEAGISQPGEMAQLEKLIHPSYGIFTHLGDAHQENFSSIEEKCREKLQLFKHVKLLVYCRDHELVHQLVKELNIPSISWGEHAESDVKMIDLPFTDKASIENVMHAFTMAYHLGLPLEILHKQVQQLEPLAMRQEMIEGDRNSLIINDTYNSDITSIHLALNLLGQKNLRHLRQVFILSDIFQTGKPSNDLYAEVAQAIAQHNIDDFIGVGPLLIRHKSLFKSPKCFFFSTTEELCESKLLDTYSNAAILVKGARFFRLEKVVKKLEKKSYQTTLEVHLGALTHNFNYFKEKINPNTLMMAMVKANAYGCGAIEVAHHLQYLRCNFLAVALADEGAELRKAGIHIPIVVMNPEPYAFDVILEHHLELEIYSMELLQSFVHFLKRFGVDDYPIHLKIDSGMHRLGFITHELPVLCNHLKEQSNVKVKSVFSHLACSDNEEMDHFTHTQVNTYIAASNFIEQEIGQSFIRHILNSAGVERFPNYQMNLVRLGIGLYGKTGSKDTNIETVSSLRTQILQIKTIPQGETIGYGRKGKVEKETRIAILPIGYADGLNRACGNGIGFVLWHNHKLPFIGSICMDMCMINLGNHPVQVGDHVMVFGKELPPYQIAEKIDTITYEILTQISSRVRKIYSIE